MNGFLMDWQLELHVLKQNIKTQLTLPRKKQQQKNETKLHTTSWLVWYPYLEIWIQRNFKGDSRYREMKEQHLEVL